MIVNDTYEINEYIKRADEIEDLFRNGVATINCYCSNCLTEVHVNILKDKSEVILNKNCCNNQTLRMVSIGYYNLVMHVLNRNSIKEYV